MRLEEIFCKLKHHFSSELESVKGNPEDPGIDCPRSGSLHALAKRSEAAKLSGASSTRRLSTYCEARSLTSTYRVVKKYNFLP
jgi:hypothetical protein